MGLAELNRRLSDAPYGRKKKKWFPLWLRRYALDRRAAIDKESDAAVGAASDKQDAARLVGRINALNAFIAMVVVFFPSSVYGSVAGGPEDFSGDSPNDGLLNPDWQFRGQSLELAAGTAPLELSADRSSSLILARQEQGSESCRQIGGWDSHKRPVGIG